MTRGGLELEGFGVAFGARRVLSELTLSLPARGMSLVVGPVASGKSTLLRTLAGLNHAQPQLLLSGRAAWNGAPLFGDAGTAPAARVALMLQNTRFFVDTVRENLASALPGRGGLDRKTQDERIVRLLEECGLGSLLGSLELEVVRLSKAVQRHLALARAIAAEPDLLMADEPTAAVEGPESDAILATLLREAERRSVVLVTHRQDHARRAGGTTHLLVDGGVRESAPTAEFFERPPSELSRTFVRTGGCLPPERPAAARELRAVRAAVRPPGFFWIERGALGGLPRPGLLTELEPDLSGLAELGVKLVVGLEERAVVSAARFAEHGIDFLHFPIRDMEAPAIEPAQALCAALGARVRRGEAVAFHCRAGLGRTGTLLAAYLVCQGHSVARAIERVRAVRPLSIQSDAQVDFLSRLGAARASGALA